MKLTNGEDFQYLKSHVTGEAVYIEFEILNKANVEKFLAEHKKENGEFLLTSEIAPNAKKVAEIIVRDDSFRVARKPDDIKMPQMAYQGLVAIMLNEMLANNEKNKTMANDIAELIKNKLSFNNKVPTFISDAIGRAFPPTAPEAPKPNLDRKK